MADPSDIDAQRVFERFSARPRSRIRGRLSLFTDESKYYPGTFLLLPTGGEVEVDEPSGSDGEAGELDTVTVIFDGGLSDEPTFGNQGNGKRVGGTTTDFAKILISIGAVTAGFTYTMTYDPDFSGLSQSGALAMVGFGFKQQNKYHFTGLKGDGSSGLNANKAYGPNFNQLRAGTETDGGAASHGTQAGPNWLRIAIAEDGLTYTLSTSSGGSTWAEEFTDDIPTPLSEATDATDFGIAIYLDGEDVGAFTVDITLWEQAAPVAGVDWFTADGANQPWYGSSTFPSAFQNGDDTWLMSQAFDGLGRAIKLDIYDHSEDDWTTTVVGAVFQTDDNHGVPAGCVDANGYGYAFYSAHNSAMRISSTAAPNDPSRWIYRGIVGSSLTYPKPVFITDTIYLLARGGTNQETGIVYATTDLTGGVPTFGTADILFDMSSSLRWYLGTVRAVAGKIHGVFSVSDSGDTIRSHVYYFIYDTATGNLLNHDESVTVLPASQPVSKATADSDFRIFAHSGGNGGNVPVLEFDTNGDPHVLFLDGASGSYALKNITNDGSGWGSAETIATLDGRYETYMLTQFPSGEMAAWYSLDGGAAWDRGGDMTRKVRSSGGTWGSATTVRSATDRALGQPGFVLGGHANARAIFAEVVNDELDANAGVCKGFLHGDGGIVQRTFAEFTDLGSAGLTLALLTAAGGGSSAPVVNAKAALEALGHTVTIIGDSSIAATTWSNYDAAVIVRVNNSDAIANSIRTNIIDAGTPVVLSFVHTGGGLSFGATGITSIPTRLDLTGTITTETFLQDLDHLDVTDATHEITDAFPAGLLRLYQLPNGRACLDSGASFVGSSLCESDPNSSGASGRPALIAIESGTNDLVASAVGARVVIGDFYPSERQFIMDGLKLLDRSVRWVAAGA